MLLAHIHKGLRSTLLPSLPSCSSAFHTFQPAQTTRSAVKARTAKKFNVKKRVARVRRSQETKPNPVFGYHPDRADLWKDSDLAKVLISQHELQKPSNVPPPVDTTVTPTPPDAFQWGLGGDPAAQELLFNALPEVTEQLALHPFDIIDLKQPIQQAALHRAQLQQLHNVHMFSRTADLRNASAAGIAFENRRRCVEAFSPPDKPNDTGSPEVQAALLTMKIRKLWDHLQQNTRDIANRRSLRKLVIDRAKILKYLKRLDRQRYVTVLGRLGIEEAAIEGELIV